MEYRTIIYNAARDGNLRRLQVFLECRREFELQSLLSAAAFGTPPLVVAARNGHLAVCEYLLEKGADIELPGCVSFDGESIEGARPLWCAAAAGHSDLLKFLIRKGANVNNTTVTNSTPLRAACFDGHLEIVKFLVEHGADVEIANKHSHTSLMIACYRGHYEVVKYLLSKGADVNRKSVKGNTALHDCAESGSVEILKLLLTCGAKMEPDSYGLTPLRAAACVGHAVIVDFLVQHRDCNNQERVESLELLGANFVDKRRDITAAVHYWRRALLLRKIVACWQSVNAVDKDELLLDEAVPSDSSTASTSRSSHECKPTFANQTLKSKQRKPIAAYNFQTEVETMEELDAIRSDPDALRIQALLIRERVLGPAHPDTAYYIRYRGAVYADIGQMSRCVLLWLYALELQQGILEPLCQMTQSSFISFAELFSFMLNDGSFAINRSDADIVDPAQQNHEVGVAAAEDGHPAFERPLAAQRFADSYRRTTVCFDDIMTVIERSVAEITRGLEAMANPSANGKEADYATALHRMCLITLHVICQICRLENRMCFEEEFRLKKTVYKLVRLDPRGAQGASLLHLACSAESSTIGRYPICRFPALSVVQLLLKVGADANALDDGGSSPLHSIFRNKVDRPSIAICLLDAGCHIDLKNKLGVTPFDLLKPTSDVEPLKYLTLKCFAAQTIRKHAISYRGKIPVSSAFRLLGHSEMVFPAKQEIVNRKVFVRSWQRQKKMAKLAMYSQCQALSCKCSGWKSADQKASTHSSLQNGACEITSANEICRGCRHNLSAHYSHLVCKSDSEVNALLDIIVDIENLHARIDEEIEADTKTVLLFIFRSLKKCVLQCHAFSCNESPFGLPPFEDITIAKALNNFATLKYGQGTSTASFELGCELSRLVCSCLNCFAMKTPSARQASERPSADDQMNYKLLYVRWLLFCSAPTYCDSIGTRYELCNIFGEKFFRAVFPQFRAQIASKTATDDFDRASNRKLNDFLDALAEEMTKCNGTSIWSNSFDLLPMLITAPEPEVGCSRSSRSRDASPNSYSAASRNAKLPYVMLGKRRLSVEVDDAQTSTATSANSHSAETRKRGKGKPSSNSAGLGAASNGGGANAAAEEVPGDISEERLQKALDAIKLQGYYNA